MRRTARGQSLTEVIVIVALVAIASIGFVGVYGDNMRGLFGASSGAVAGKNTCNTGVKNAQANAHRDLHSFGMAGGAEGAGTDTNAICSPGGGPPKGGKSK